MVDLLYRLLELKIGWSFIPVMWGLNSDEISDAFTKDPTVVHLHIAIGINCQY
jgi:hypothetical protein